MRLMISPSSWAYGLGPLSRCMAIAEAAASRGHSVAFMCSDWCSQTIQTAGFETFPLPGPTPHYPTSPDLPLGRILDSLGASDDHFVLKSVDAETDALRAFAADAVYADYQLSAPISARAAGIVSGITVNWADHRDFKSPLFPPDSPSQPAGIQGFNSTLNRLGAGQVEDVSDIFFRLTDIKIAPSYPVVDPCLEAIESPHFVGHIGWRSIEYAELSSATRSWLAESSHLVLAYFGTGEIDPTLCADVLRRAFSKTDLKVVAALGPEADDELLSGSTQNVMFMRTIPASALLPRAAAILFHGGRNSMMNAIRNGVPCLMFSCHDAERDYYARRAELLGIGLRLGFDDFYPSSVLRLTRAVMEGDCRERARILSASLPNLGGAEQVVDVFEATIR